MTQKTQAAGFCDALAEPSPTDRQTVGRLSRKVTGEVWGRRIVSRAPVGTAGQYYAREKKTRRADFSIRYRVQGSALAVATAAQY